MRARLIWAVASLEARTAMSYRVDFWLNSLATPLTQLVIAYYLWAEVFRQSGAPTIGGLAFRGMLGYYLAAILLGRLVRGREFQDTIAAEIYDGHLNRYLVFPAPYFPFKYAQHLGQMAPLVVQAGAICALVIGCAWPRLPLPEPSALAMTAVIVALANLLHFLMLAPLQCVAFWADNVWSLVVAQRFATNLLGGLLLPLALFPDWALAALRWLPFQLVFDVPARTLMGRVGVAEWARYVALGAGWCALLALITAAVWRRGRLRYAGVGI